MKRCIHHLMPAMLLVLLLLGFAPAAHAEPYPAGLNWEVWANGCTLPDGDDFCAATRDWLEMNGGLSNFGLPIGHVQVVDRDGKTILEAPFERFRVDFDDTKPDPYQFELGIMGEAALLKQGRVWQNEPQASPRPDCDFFAETGHNACGAFRDFWHGHGLNFDNYDDAYKGRITYQESLALLGFPITEEEAMTRPDGSTLTVQYFQRGRLELHPENAGTPYYVQMGLLNSEVTGETAWALLPGNSPAGQPVTQPVAQPDPQPTAAPSEPTSGVRIGAVCRDGTRSSATGRGACSHHGGVAYWLYR